MPFRSQLRSRYRRRGVRRGMLNPRNVTYGLRAFAARGFGARLRLRKYARRNLLRSRKSTRTATGRITSRVTRRFVSNTVTPSDFAFSKVPFKRYRAINGDGVKTNQDQTIVATGLKNPLGEGGGLIFPGQVRLSAMYGRYYVYKSSISMKIWNPTALDYQLTLVPRTTNTALTQQDIGNEEGIWALPNAKSVLVLRSTLGNQHSVKTLTHTMTTKKMYPTHDSANEIAHQADFGADYASNNNPNTNWYWHIVLTHPNGEVIEASSGLYYRITLTQSVRFSNVKDQNSYEPTNA